MRSVQSVPTWLTRHGSHLRLQWSLGTVKAEPDSCSAYRPYGHFCGLFCAQGNNNVRQRKSRHKNTHNTRNLKIEPLRIIYCSSQLYQMTLNDAICVPQRQMRCYLPFCLQSQNFKMAFVPYAPQTFHPFPLPSPRYAGGLCSMSPTHLSLRQRTRAPRVFTLQLRPKSSVVLKQRHPAFSI